VKYSKKKINFLILAIGTLKNFEEKEELILREIILFQKNKIIV